jgi:hypothetical protein
MYHKRILSKPHISENKAQAMPKIQGVDYYKINL